VVIAGHSEGSLIGMLAAKQAPADAFISIAGPGERAADGLRRQLRPQIGGMAPLWDAHEEILQSLEAGMPVTALPAAVQAVPPIAQLYRASVQRYLISWFRYSPATEFASLMTPALIVQGTTDLQVRVEDAKLLAGANPRAGIAIVEGMNHVLKQAPAEPAQNLATYSNPALPIVSDALTRIVAFVRALA
jgi:uncharacterized protein